MKAAKKGAESLHRGLRRHRALVLSSVSVPPPPQLLPALLQITQRYPSHQRQRVDTFWSQTEKHGQQRAVVFVQLEQRREGWTRRDEEWRVGWNTLLFCETKIAQMLPCSPADSVTMFIIILAKLDNVAPEVTELAKPGEPLHIGSVANLLIALQAIMKSCCWVNLCLVNIFLSKDMNYHHSLSLTHTHTHERACTCTSWLFPELKQIKWVQLDKPKWKSILESLFLIALLQSNYKGICWFGH